MELRLVDPRTLIENPENPRRKSPVDQHDEQMAATARVIGILNPPHVRETPKGLMTIAGHRRVRGSIAAELTEINVLVLGEGEEVSDDRMRALVENVARKAMSPVETWKGIEKLISERWTEEAISTALTIQLRVIRKLRLLARVHPPMLDRMHLGDMPAEGYLRVIAAAPADEQASVWKANKPRKGEACCWMSISRALTRQKMMAANASFGAAEAEAFGVVWEEDLFAQADEDSRYTTQVDAYISAQAAWLEANLQKGAVVLNTDVEGRPQLPRGSQRHYYEGASNATTGCYVDPRDGQIHNVFYSTVETTTNRVTSSEQDKAEPEKKPRGPITANGVSAIGDMRTYALHQALQSDTVNDPNLLLGFLVLAFGGLNVDVNSGQAAPVAYGQREGIARRLLGGGKLTRDPATLQAAAREMLTQVLSCRDNYSRSGVVARHVGQEIGADAYLPTMATDEFLKNLSKTEIERVAAELGVGARQTGKATREAVIARCKDEVFVYPAARFELTSEETGREGARVKTIVRMNEDDEIEDAGVLDPAGDHEEDAEAARGMAIDDAPIDEGEDEDDEASPDTCKPARRRLARIPDESQEIPAAA